MIGPDGPKVLEFNARFGDPETQAVLPRLRSDRRPISPRRARAGRPGRGRREFGDDWAVTLVLASAGYPESSSKGDVIGGLDAAAELAEVTHAGTAERDGEIVTAGGRVLNVTALGATPAEARDRAVRCRQPDLLRRNADPHRHRRPRRRARPQLTQSREERDERDLRGAPADRSGNPRRSRRPTGGDDAGGRGGLRGDRRRRAAGRDHHGLEERQAEDAAGRQGAAGGRHPLRGAGDERPPRPRDGPRVLHQRADARAEGDHRRRRDVGGAARASPPPTPTCR